MDPVLPVLLLACLISPASGLAQARSPVSEPRLVDVQVEPSEPSFGRAFELRATLRIPPGTVAFLPDTLLPSDAIESVGPGRWSASSGPADSVDVQSTYPVMAFRGGRSNLPALEIWIWENGGPGRPLAAARSLDELGADPRARAEPHLLRLGAVTVAPLLSSEDSAADLEPRPSADVVGGTWNAWLLLATALLAAGGIAGVWAILRWRRRGTGPGSPFGGSRVSPRVEALQELDRIRAAAWHRSGRTVEFYRSSTGALRYFARRTEPHWGMALTSSELLRRIEARWGVIATKELADAVAVAEAVKFGAHRPDPEAAENDWQTIRAWVQGVPDAD